MHERPLTIEITKPPIGYTRCIIFDRDGVVNEKAPEHEHIKAPDQVRMLEGFYELVNLFKTHSDKAIAVIFTNQQWLAYEATPQAFIETSEHINNELIKRCGIGINRVMCCPHRHEDPNCNCRKPKPGMLTEIMETYALVPEQCMVIGDTEFDILAAQNAGIENYFLVTTDKPLEAYDKLKEFLNGK